MALSQYLKENVVSDSLHQDSVVNFLAAMDANGERSGWRRLNTCPACQSTQINASFDKWSFEFWACECGHQFVNPMPNDDSLGQWYRHSASFLDYQQRAAQTRQGRREHIYVKRWRQICDVDNGVSSLLEVGCGEGDFLRYAAEQRPELRLMGCDLAEPVASAESGGFEFILGDAAQVLREPHEAQLICMFELIEHVPDPQALLSALQQGAAAGTRLIMSTPNNQGFDAAMLGQDYHLYLPPGHINLFCPSSMEALLGRLGFRDIRICANGTMDVAIVRNYYRQGKWQPDAHWQRIFEQDKQAFMDDYQALLAKHNLAGNLLVSARV